MPNLNGDEATWQARQAGYQGPIVMVSGDTFEPCEANVLKKQGITAFLTKMAEPGLWHALQLLKKKKQFHEEN